MRSKIDKKRWKKHEKTGAEMDEKSIENMMVYNGAEPRLALYSSLIIHFGRFRKRENQIENVIENQ